MKPLNFRKWIDEHRDLLKPPVRVPLCVSGFVIVTSRAPSVAPAAIASVAVSCVAEGHAGNDAEIREYMSGNLCRCAAYPNIVAAIKQAKGSREG